MHTRLQVVIRVRPPLPRELQGYTSYQCTSLVDARSGQLITVSENLPAVLSGQGANDGMLYATYRCVRCVLWVSGRSNCIISSSRRHACGGGTLPPDTGLKHTRTHARTTSAPARFTFDHVYDQDSSQQAVYQQSAKPLVLSTLQVRAVRAAGSALWTTRAGWGLSAAATSV
jgi:hypothetical protein